MAKKEHKRGKGEGSIYLRFAAQFAIKDSKTGKPKQINICGKTRPEVEEKLSRFTDIDKSKVSITQSWVAQIITGHDPKTGKVKRRAFYGKTGPKSPKDV